MLGCVRGGRDEALCDPDKLPSPADVPCADGEGGKGVWLPPCWRASDPMRGGALRRAAQGFGGIEISEDDEDEDLEFHADHAVYQRKE
ncbi:hypothetical protein MUK42_11782 [Musa troglodytarum]|uniref:Uncharacterized protein n=1 Tax=Musa troglodytarum TaxID=320322 RepID=A0A9E7GJB6_9LILI|nr:hypothetical protein MUK42_11782 [Musa troglodytarum]